MFLKTSSYIFPFHRFIVHVVQTLRSNLDALNEGETSRLKSGCSSAIRSNWIMGKFLSRWIRPMTSRSKRYKKSTRSTQAVRDGEVLADPQSFCLRFAKLAVVLLRLLSDSSTRIPWMPLSYFGILSRAPWSFRFTVLAPLSAILWIRANVQSSPQHAFSNHLGSWQANEAKQAFRSYA